MTNPDPKTRALRALDRIVGKPFPAVIGWRRSETVVSTQVPGRPNHLYITLGDQTVTTALNRAGVPRSAFWPVLVARENDTLVIVGTDNRNAGTFANIPDNEYGVTPHPFFSHSDNVATALADGDVPQWDAATSKWVNVPAPPGAPGPAGGDSMEYGYLDEIVDADPGSGSVAFNSLTFASVTEIYIDDENLAADDVQAWFAAMDDSTNTVKGNLRIFNRANNIVFWTFQVLGVTEAVGYWKISVAPVVAAGSFVEGDVVVVSFARAGDAGDAADIAAEIGAAATDDTLADADLFGYVTGGSLVKTTWSNLKATLKSYFDTLYGLLASANTWTQINTFSSRVDAPIVRANSVAGLRLEDDGGNPGITIEDGGFVGVGPGATNPNFELHVGKNQNASTVVNVSNADATNTLSRATFRAACNDVVFRFEAITGFGAIAGTQTNHDLYLITNDTARMFVDKGGSVGVGTTAPQGKLHAHDGTGGWLFVTKSGVAGTAVTVIPDGSGDVLYNLRVRAATRDSAGNLQNVDINAAPGASGMLYNDGGANVLTLAVAANGSVTVQRTAGSRTYMTNLFLMWL